MHENDMDKVSTMLRMQEALNIAVHADWRVQNFQWHRAIWRECGELLDHYGYKWWKDETRNVPQCCLELVDIWHFGLSMILLQSGTDEDKVKTILAQSEFNRRDGDVRELIDELAGKAASDRVFHIGLFFSICDQMGLSLDMLFMLYCGKNTLNRFREKMGYKIGSYQKIWGGLEDNEHLFGMLANAPLSNINPATLQNEIMGRLQNRYDQYCNSQSINN